MDHFFDRAPNLVANDLIGKRIQIGELSIIIDNVIPKESQANKRWRSAPLFCDNPVDAYATRYRGVALLLFLRTERGPDEVGTCVRIEAGHTDSGRNLTTPTAVSTALGIGERIPTNIGSVIGDVTYKEGVISIIWR